MCKKWVLGRTFERRILGKSILRCGQFEYINQFSAHNEFILVAFVLFDICLFNSLIFHLFVIKQSSSIFKRCRGYSRTAARVHIFLDVWGLYHFGICFDRCFLSLSGSRGVFVALLVSCYKECGWQGHCCRRQLRIFVFEFAPDLIPHPHTHIHAFIFFFTYPLTQI
jgi:hypothetical protein